MSEWKLTLLGALALAFLSLGCDVSGSAKIVDKPGEKGIEFELKIEPKPPTPPPAPPTPTTPPPASQPSTQPAQVQSGDPPERSGETIKSSGKVVYWEVGPPGPTQGYWYSQDYVSVALVLPKDYTIFETEFDVISATTYSHPEDSKWKVLEVVGYVGPVFEYLKFNAGISAVTYTAPNGEKTTYNEQYLLDEGLIAY